jgi:hypothetical protein
LSTGIIIGMTDDRKWTPGELSPIRGNMRAAGFRRVSHGLYLPTGVGGDARHEQLRDLSAWQLVLPPDAVFTHVTAADLCGWWLPKLPRFVPVFAATALDGRVPRRAGLICSRLTRSSQTGTVDGLPVDSPCEILLRAARDLALIDLVVMLDSALRLGHVKPDDLDQYSHSRRPGSRRLRHAVTLSDPRAESAWEAMLRLFHGAVDIDVEPQYDVVDDAGRLAARVDLWVKGTPFVHEYDGDEHEKAPRRKADLRRARRLLDAGVERRGYVADDLLNHASAMLQEMDRELGRPHRPARLRKWYAWLRESSYSVAGRRRLQNRWLKVNGRGTDWGQTA